MLKRFLVNHYKYISLTIVILSFIGAGSYLLLRSHAATPYGIAFESNTSYLWTQTSNSGYGMASGTSPAMTALPGGGYEIAFHANDGNLWTIGTAGTKNWGLGMAAGTSPAIAASSSGYEVAFQANTGNLWMAGSTQTMDLGLGMASKTNPSIIPYNGSYLIAFQANTGNLWITQSGSYNTDTGLGMSLYTSPSIAQLGSSYEIAFQANTNVLWTTGAGGNKNWGLPMTGYTSPSIASQYGGYEIAYESSNHNLWMTGTAWTNDTGLGMASSTSPSMITYNGSYLIAFEANTGNLWITQSGSNNTDLGLGMYSGTSPSIANVSLPSPPPEPSLGSSLSIGNNINAGYALYSPNDIYRAVMQTDGNFVVYYNWTESPIWSTGTNGSGANIFNFQTDGNLVVRPSGSSASWAAGTNTYCGTYLSMQDNGNLALYASGGSMVWSWETGKVGPACPSQPPPCNPDTDPNCPPPSSYEGTLDSGSYLSNEYLIYNGTTADIASTAPRSVRFILFCATDICSGNISNIDGMAHQVQSFYKNRLGHTFTLQATTRVTGHHSAAYYHNYGAYNALATLNHLLNDEPEIHVANVKTVVVLGFRSSDHCGTTYIGFDYAVVDPHISNCVSWEPAVEAHELGHAFGLGHVTDGTLMNTPAACNATALQYCSINSHQAHWLLYYRKPWFPN